MDSQQTAQQPPVSPSISSAPLPPPKPRLPLLLGGLFVSLVILGGSYFVFGTKKPATPTPISQLPPTAIPTTDPTVNWKIYNNSELGYSIKYPDTLKVVIPQLEGNPKIKLLVLTDMTVKPNGNPDENNVLYEEIGGVGGDGIIIYKGFWLRIETTALDSPDDVIENIRSVNKNSKSLNIDGAEAYQRISSSKGGNYEGTNVWVDIVKEKKVYVIQASFSANVATYPILFDQILSTFTFLDQNQTDETINWKTYTLPEVYTFKYPADPVWEISSTQAPLGNSVMLQCGNSKCLPENNVDLFQVTPIISKSVDEYIKDRSIITDYKKIQFDGFEAINSVIPGGPQAGGSTLETFVVFKGQGYALSYRFQGLYDKNKLEDIPSPNPDILSTFKFLE